MAGGSTTKGNSNVIHHGTQPWGLSWCGPLLQDQRNEIAHMERPRSAQDGIFDIMQWHDAWTDILIQQKDTIEHHVAKTRTNTSEGDCIRVWVALKDR